MALIYVALVLGLACGAAAFYSARRIKKLRDCGIYPLQGQVTEESIRKLLSGGHRIEATRAYRELHGVDLKTAKEAIERINA